MNIPKDRVIDAVIPVLLSSGYEYISERCERFGTDLFETRVLGRRAICFRGEEAARAFYDPELFKRRGATPARLLRGLLGRGGVHGLDGAEHYDRKQMFLSLMSTEALNRLSLISTRHWSTMSAEWEKAGEIRLFPQSQEILCRAICEWAGVPLREPEVKERTRDLAAMVDSFGALGSRYRQGVKARARTEGWIRGIVRDIRSRSSNAQGSSPAEQIALHRGPSGALLKERTAAVELINLIRPAVAIAYFITFAALALHDHPECRERIKMGDERLLRNFVQEVRRFYPFAPAMGAIARQDFIWKGFEIPRGRLVILDLYGTNHDPGIWKDPGEFLPERFQSWNESPFNFIPNGGGDFEMGHRCAGEWITIEELMISVRFLSRNLEYAVPEQDLGFPLTRLPTFPRSGFVMRDIRRVTEPMTGAA